MGEIRNARKFFLVNQQGRDHLKDLGLDRKIILEWILEK
jgi:hypothetical protein